MNRLTSSPTIKDLLDKLKREIFLSFNCHAIATVQSFDSSKRTITATINYKKTFLQRSDDGTYTTVPKDYPILLDVPIIILQGGGGRLTFPIKKDDCCLILFNDRDIDNWIVTGQVAQVATSRAHSISDGIALIGLWPSSKDIGEYDEEHVSLEYDGGRVAVGPKIQIENEISDLKTIINGMLDLMASITVTCASAGNPSSVPINAAAISAYKTTVGGLLE